MPKRIKRKTPRAEAQTYMEGYAARGISANQALKNLRKMGLGYKRTIFLKDYRTYTGKEKAKDVAKHIRKDKYPTEATITPDVRNLKDKFQSLISYEYQDLATGEIKSKCFYIGHEQPIRVGTLESLGLNLVSEHLDEYNASLIGVSYRGTRARVD